jgi:DNA-binding transcriptional regulator YiaG
MSRATRTNEKKAGGRPNKERPGEKTPVQRSAGLSPAGAKIVAAFEEAIAVMQSADPSAPRLTARTYRADFVTRDYGPDDVRRVRGLLGMSQAVFARFLGVDANTVRSWEQGTRPPSAIARRFMGEIESDPDYWRRRVGQSLVAASAEDPAGA